MIHHRCCLIVKPYHLGCAFVSTCPLPASRVVREGKVGSLVAVRTVAHACPLPLCPSGLCPAGQSKHPGVLRCLPTLLPERASEHEQAAANARHSMKHI